MPTRSEVAIVSTTREQRRVRRRGRVIPVDGSTPSDEDGRLMLAFAGGDAGAFEQLYERHRGGLYRFVKRSIQDHGLAEELFQDIWMRVIRARERYQPTARFQTWLYRIATNRIIDHVRASRPQVTLDDDCPQDWLLDDGPAPADEPDRSAMKRALERAIAALPLEQRTAFLLQAEQGFSLEEIAQASGVGRETVKSRLRYAMNKLRETLGSWHEPES